MSQPGMEKLLKKAREMKEKQDRELAKAIVQAKAAGGKIAGKMNAHRSLLSLDIDPELVRVEHRELLEEKLLELVNDLACQVDGVLKDRFGIRDQMPMPDLGEMFDRP